MDIFKRTFNKVALFLSRTLSKVVTSISYKDYNHHNFSRLRESMSTDSLNKSIVKSAEQAIEIAKGNLKGKEHIIWLDKTKHVDAIIQRGGYEFNNYVTTFNKDTPLSSHILGLLKDADDLDLNKPLAEEDDDPDKQVRRKK